MRDYLSSRIPVEDFRGLKKKELTELYLKVKEKENSSPTSEDSPTTTQPEQPEVQEQSREPEIQESHEQSVEPEVSEGNNTETSQQENVVNITDDSEKIPVDDGKGTGLSLVPETHKTYRISKPCLRS